MYTNQVHFIWPDSIAFDVLRCRYVTQLHGKMYMLSNDLNQHFGHKYLCACKGPFSPHLFKLHSAFLPYFSTEVFRNTPLLGSSMWPDTLTHMSWKFQRWTFLNNHHPTAFWMYKCICVSCCLNVTWQCAVRHCIWTFNLDIPSLAKTCLI